MAAKKRKKNTTAGGARKNKPAGKKSSRKPASKRFHNAPADAAAEPDSESPAPQRCAVVGLGPANNGRVAFRQVLEAQSNDDGMAYVFIPRLESTQEQLIEGLLSTLPGAGSDNFARALNVQEKLKRRERQQGAVAELGQAALAGKQLPALFDKAVRLVADRLETGLCHVLELSRCGRELSLVAGVGWKEGLVGSATVGVGLNSQAGYTLQRAGTVIAQDLKTEKRFHSPDWLKDHGVVSGITVVIGPPDEPWGVLGAHGQRRLHFTVDDANFLQAVANVLWGAIARRRAEEALRQSEEGHRLVMDALPVLIAYCDADCVYRFCNAAYEDWFGLQRNEVVGHRLVDVLGRDACRKFEPHIRRVLAGEQVQFEQELSFKYGPSRHVHVEYVPHEDESTAVVGYYAMIEDVSDRRQVERQILDANNRLSAVVETAADGIVTIDADGRIESANRAVTTMFGYAPEELLGRNVKMLMPEPYRGEHDEYLRRYERTGEARIIGAGREVLGRRKDATTFPLDLAVSEFTLGDQRRFTGILRDISEEKRAEESLRQHEAQLRLITDSVPALIAYVDRRQRCRFMNAAFEEWIDRPWDEVHGLSVRELLGDEQYEHVQEMLENVLAGQPQMFEYEASRRDGSIRQMQVHYIPHREPDGAVLGYIVVMTDVTDSYHSVAERAMLDASDRERQRIGQDLHDSLGQELTGLSLMAQNVVDELRSVNHTAAETAELLTHGLRQALQRVRQMSRGLVPIDEIDRRGLIVALENLVGQTNQAGRIKCAFRCSQHVDIPELPTAKHVYRIAQEAIANAVKHAGAHRVDVRLEQDEAAVKLTIRDDGEGLPQNWRQLPGMGLRIMRYRADRIGGSLTIHSDPAQGTEVICTTPSNRKG